jgi:hypothetical protein
MLINPLELIARIVPILALSLLLGCGTDDMSGPKLIPVKGKVSYKGKPLAKGTVRFSADGYGRDASGQLQPDGTYEIGTMKPGDGTTAGSHRVFITEVEKSLSKDKAFQKYASPVASKLVVDVSPENNEFNLDLPR